MFDGIIFDLDGLITDSEGWQLQSWNEYLSRYEVQLDAFDWDQLTNRRAYEVADIVRLRYDLPPDPLSMTEERQALLMELIEGQPQIEPLPGVRDALEMLRNNNLKLAIATSSYRDYVWAVLERAGLDESFDVLVSGETVAETRPSPVPLLACAETFAVHPSDCLALAKDRDGVEAAINARMKVICVPGPGVVRWRISGADLVLPSLEALNMPLLRSIWFEVGEEPQTQLYRLR